MSDQDQQYLQLIAKCWADADFKQRLLEDPMGTLKAEGIEVPAGMRVQVVENTAEVYTLVIPMRPNDVLDEMLSGVAGGATIPFKVNRPRDPSLQE